MPGGSTGVSKVNKTKHFYPSFGIISSFRSTAHGQEMNPPKNWSLSARDNFPIAVGILKKGRMVISMFISHLTVKGRHEIK